VLELEKPTVEDYGKMFYALGHPKRMVVALTVYKYPNINLAGIEKETGFNKSAIFSFLQKLSENGVIYAKWRNSWQITVLGDALFKSLGILTNKVVTPREKAEEIEMNEIGMVKVKEE